MMLDPIVSDGGYAADTLRKNLEITYRLESDVYNNRKKETDRKLEVAKEAQNKLKKNRSSLLGSFLSTHSRLDIDKSFVEIKLNCAVISTMLTSPWRRQGQLSDN